MLVMVFFTTLWKTSVPTVYISIHIVTQICIPTKTDNIHVCM
jgi:hypothetical protein